MASRLAWRSIPRLVRFGLLACAALVVVVVGGAGILLASFDPDSWKPQIIEAVKRETGRDIVLNGHIGLALALQPTMAVPDVVLANPPGFSRPQMATLGRLDLKLALLPLLSRRIEIVQLVLVRPDILLETDAQGRRNWQFTPAASGATQPKAAAPTGQTGDRSGLRIDVASLSIEDGTLTWRDDRSGRSAVLGIKRLEASAASSDSPLHLDASASYNGLDFALAGDVGPVARLVQAPATTTPWPVNLEFASAGAKLAVDGSLAHPLQGRGYTFKVAATVPDLAALSALLPGEKLPPLHDVSLSAQLADSGGELPMISAVTLHVGSSDLSGTVPGLKLDKLDVAAAGLDQPVKASGQASFAELPLSLAASLGAPGALLSGAQPGGPFAVDISLQGGGASLAVKGSIAQPRTLAGVDLAVTANVANLAALSPLAHRSLPPLQSIAFQGTVQDADGGLGEGVALHAAKLSMPQGDLAGDATVSIAARPLLQAKLTSDKIDLDALRASFAVAAAEPAVANPAQAAPAPPSPPVAKNGRLIPDTPLPFALLQLGDADLALTVNQLKSGGALYRAVAGHLAVRDGKLTLDRFTADLPEGRVAGALTADAKQSPPGMALQLHAPALAVQPLLAAFGQPNFASGNLEVRADLRGAGATSHGIAASLNGSLGLAMANGSVDNRLLGSTLGSVLREINLLDLVGRGGISQIQCFASWLDFRDGIGTFRTLLLASSLLTADGAGSINLGAETLDLRLQSQARVGGTGVVVPLRVSGSLRNPTAAPDPAAAVTANAGTIAGMVGSATPLGMIAGALAGQKLQKVLGGASVEDCGSALAVARGGGAGAAAGTVQPPPAAPVERQVKPPNVGAVLRQLFR